MPINTTTGLTYSEDISEDFQYDLSSGIANSSFDNTNINYDMSINSIPFLVSPNNQNKYQRETAQYRKDQFDASVEPGEQSFTGWWLRSQTSWHNGAGITFYEPGTDYQYVSHRFADSRGVDVWTIGEAKLLPEVFHAYTGIQGINAAAGNDGTSDVLVSGDANGILKKITLNSNSSASTADYVHTATSFPQGHSATPPFFGFTSVTTSGGRYYATCSGAIHRGTIGTLDSDVVFARHSAGSKAFVKYAKGFIFFGENNILNLIDDSQGNTNAHSGALPAGKQYDSRTHLDSTFVWNDIAGGQKYIYASGNAGNNGEIWKIGFEAEPVGAAGVKNSTLLPDLSSATVNISLPDSELVNAIHFYLGYLVVGTNKGIRICQVNADGDLTLGPLLIETSYSVNGFTERGTYIYAATKADAGSYTNAILIRIDLSQPFNDGTFPYAYDLEYQTNLQPSSSEATEVYNIDNRLVMVIEEDGTGELQVEHSTDKRSTGWLKTGSIRFATTEPKFFKFISLGGNVSSEDTITVTTIDTNGFENDLLDVDSRSLNKNIEISKPARSIEKLSFKFTFNNNSPLTSLPILESYQVKALPAIRRQRLIQYPLSCFNFEKDRFNSQFGYETRAYEVMRSLELLEEESNLVSVHDYRTGEVYTGLIEEVRFSNESSPDKNNSNFGGLLLVTIRKIS